MPPLNRDELRKVPYVDVANLGGRTLYLLPYWNGSRWHLWMPQPDGTLLELHPRDAAQTDYVAAEAAAEDDMAIYFVNVVWQRLATGAIRKQFRAILDDFHSLATSVAKIDHFFGCSERIGLGSSMFVGTELEYILIRCRSVFDHLQEVISVAWDTEVRLDDPDRQKKKRRPPQSFADVLFANNQRRTSEAIVDKYQFPKALAEAYVATEPFFTSVRDARNRIIHGLGSRDLIFRTERGWCVSQDDSHFRDFGGWDIWTAAHRYNDRLVSLRPLLAHLVFGTISACGQMADSFVAEISCPAPIAPNHTVFVRSMHGSALARLDKVLEGGSPWWA